MSNTRNRARSNGSAPELESATATLDPASESTPEVESTPEPASESTPEPEPALDLDAIVEEEEIGKGRRVFREITKRGTMDDGRFTCVAREVRADGTEGPHLVALVRINEKEPKGSDKRESVTYSDAKTMRAQVRALAAIGVRFISH